jgi:hypothetical protein
MTAPILAPAGRRWQLFLRQMTYRRKRRTVTTVETREVWVVRRMAPVAAYVPCADCADQTTLLAPEEAARLSGLSLRAVFRRVEAGHCHFLEAEDGRLLVCPAFTPRTACRIT